MLAIVSEDEANLVLATDVQNYVCTMYQFCDLTVWGCREGVLPKLRVFRRLLLRGTISAPLSLWPFHYDSLTGLSMFAGVLWFYAITLAWKVTNQHIFALIAGPMLHADYKTIAT